MRPSRSLTTLALLCAPIASAQTWSQTIASASNGSVLEARELPSGEIAVLHRSNFSNSNLLRLDAAGNLLSARELQRTGAGLWSLSSGRLAVCGGQDFDCNAWLSVLDAGDNTVWSQQTTTSDLTYAFLESVRETSDGGLLAVGYTVMDDCDREALAYKFDASGTLVWDFHFGSASNYIYVSDGVELADGTFRLVGATTFHHLAMIELDAGGQFVSTRSWDTTTSLSYPQTRVEIASDGNLLLVPGPQSQDKAFLVMKVAPDGTPVWEREYLPADRGIHAAIDVVPTSDGGGVVLGHTYTFGFVGDLVLMRFDSAGDVVWQRLHGGPELELAHSLSTTADGGYLICGQTGDPFSHLEGLLLRVDAAGELAGCPSPTASLSPKDVSMPTGVPTGPFDLFSSPFAAGPSAVATTPPATTFVCLQATVGQTYCSPAVPNSSGASAVLWAIGSEELSDDYLLVSASEMPTSQFGYFLTGQGSTVVQPPGAQGNLCLDGATIYRYAANVQNTGAGGAFAQTIDVNQIPGHGAIQPGETWNFQAWFRDQNPGTTSNFTDAVGVSFF